MSPNFLRIFLVIGFFLLAVAVQNVGSRREELVRRRKMPSVFTHSNEVLRQAAKAEEEGNYKTALAYYTTLIPLYEQKLGPFHPETIGVLKRKFRAFGKAQMHEEALQMGWKIFRLEDKIHGKEHVDTIEALFQLGRTYYAKRRYKKAEEVLKRAYRLAKFQPQLGQNHKQTLLILSVLADVYRTGSGWSDDAEKLDLALRYYRKIWSVWSKDPEVGEEHEWTLLTLQNIGHVLGLQNKFEEAVKIVEKVVEVKGRTFGEAHPLTQEAKNLLVLVLSRSGKIGQANKILKELRPNYSLSESESNSNLDAHDKSLFALVGEKLTLLAEQGKFGQALEILENLYERETLKKLWSPKILPVLEHLIKYNVEQREFDQAEKWANVVIDVIQNQYQNQNQGQRKTKKVKFTKEEDGENLIFLHLHALEALIYTNVHRHDETKVDHLFKTSQEVIRGQLRSITKADLRSTMLEKYFFITMKVAVLKNEIGEKAQALQILRNFIDQNSVSASFVTLGLDTITQVAIDINDYKFVEEIALKFLSHDSGENPEGLDSASDSEKLELEPELELRNKDDLREFVSEYLLIKARELFTLENYPESFSLLKMVEDKIWPKSWTWDTDHGQNLEFLTGITGSALMLEKFDQALFYLEKETTILNNKLATAFDNDNESKMDEQERVQIVQRIQASERLQEELKQALENLVAEKNGQGKEEDEKDKSEL